MSDSSKNKNGPVRVIDSYEEAVREYLNSLDQPVEPKRFNPAEVLEGITDPIAKLRALTDAKRRADSNELEDRFVEVGARWAERNGIGREAFIALGVPAAVIRRAFGASMAAPTGPKRTRISVETLAAGIKARPPGSRLSIADIAAEIGGSTMTIRKVLDQLAGEGHISNDGPDPDYRGPGRAPNIFERK